MMWLVVTFLLAVAASALHLAIGRKHNLRLGFLALMLWGTFIMVLVDHTIAFMDDGGDFIWAKTDGLVSESAVLGILMVLPLLMVWAVTVHFKVGSRSAHTRAVRLSEPRTPDGRVYRQ